jgi:hypothetical protein
MKKLIISMIILISTTALKAQSTYEPATELVTKFNNQFGGATEAKWSKKGDVIGVGFQHEGFCKIAYYDQDGKLVASGRKISQSQLPMKINQEIASTRISLEKKTGPYTAGSCYEFLKESGSTEYVILLENSRESVTLVSENDQTRIENRSKKVLPLPTTEVIAKKSDN